MILLDATLEVPADGRLVVTLPPGSSAVAVRVLVTDAVAAPVPAAPPAPTPPDSREGAAIALPWPTIDTEFGAEWDPNETFRRVDMYGDDGR